MADKKISALTASSLPLAGTEVLPIVQSGATVKVAVDDLTVKNIRSNATTGILQVAGPTAGTTRVATVPDANFTVARTDAAQTFTGTQSVGFGASLRLNRSDNAIYNEMYYGAGDLFVFNQANGGQYSFRINNTQYLAITNSYFAPGGDGTMNFGLAGNRMNTIYATNGTINTSDAAEKQQIRELDVAEQAVAKRLKGLIRAYKFNDAVKAKGDKARIHVGVIAQDVRAAFEAEGLVAEHYALFCSDTWTNDEGKEVTRLGVRYGELLAFIISTL